jgi:DHA2 family multidrug resistance protein
MNADETQPKINPWMIALAVMLPTFMEVLDTTIANVSLSHIAGNLSVSTDESTWVLTSYLIANAIIIPCTAWLGQRFGRKNFLMFCVIVFTGASFLCGLATSLPMLLAMRDRPGCRRRCVPADCAIHHAGKLSQGKARHGDGRLWHRRGDCADHRPGARWLDHGQLQLALDFLHQGSGRLAGAVAHPALHPRSAVDRNVRPPRLDVIGLSFMSLWLGCQEVLLDKGQEDDWFGSRFIIMMAVLAVMGLVRVHRPRTQTANRSWICAC